MIKFDKIRQTYEVIKRKQYDTLEPLKASFYNNNIPINLAEYTIKLECIKIDNTIVIQEKNIIVKNTNELEVILDPQITVISGEVKGQFVLNKNGLRDTTFTFYINVDPSTIATGMESESTITVLDTLIKKVDEAIVVKKQTENLVENGGAATTGQVAEVRASLEDNTDLLGRNGAINSNSIKDFKIKKRQSSKFVTDEGILLELFDNVSNFSLTGTGNALENSSINCKKTKNSIKAITNNAGTMCRFQRGINLTLLDSDNLGLWFFIEDRMTLTSISITMTDNSNGDFANNFTKNIWSHNVVNGWNFIKFMKEDCVKTGTLEWATTFKFLRINVVGIIGKNAVVYFDSFMKNVKMKPIILLHFDDSQIGLYRIGYPYMRDRNIRSTIFVSNRSTNPNYLGQPARWFMNVEEHEDVYMNGKWDLSIHSKSHNDITDLSTSTSYDDQYNELNYTREFLVKNGWLRGVPYFSAPNGKYNKITEKVMEDMNIKLVRSSSIGNIDYLDSETILTPTQEIRRETTWVQIKKYIDDAIRLGSIAPIFTHDIAVNNQDAYSMEYSLFTQMIDYMVAKRDSGEVLLLSFDELYSQSFDKEIDIDAINEDFQLKNDDIITKSIEALLNNAYDIGGVLKKFKTLFLSQGTYIENGTNPVSQTMYRTINGERIEYQFVTAALGGKPYMSIVLTNKTTNTILEQYFIGDDNIRSSTNGIVDIGALNVRFKNAYFNGFVVVGSGATHQRPTDAIVGSGWFDITKNKPIWFNGTVWVDAMGNTI